MTPSINELVSLYFAGRLGEGAALGLETTAAYTLSAIGTLLIATMAVNYRIDDRSILWASSLATILVTPQIIRGFLSSDINAFEVSFYFLLTCPSTWILPALAVISGKRALFDDNNTSRKTEICTILALQAWGLIVLFYPFI
jgi:hypothetical protein